MSEQISFVIDNKKYFTAFGAEGLLAEHLVDSNVVEQSVLIGSSALTRSYGRLYPGGTIAVPTVTITDYTMDGKYFILTGERDGVSYQLTRDGVTRVDSAAKEQKDVEETSVNEAISVEELMGKSALTVSEAESSEEVPIQENHVGTEAAQMLEDTNKTECYNEELTESKKPETFDEEQSSVMPEQAPVIVEDNASVEERRAALRELLRNSNAGLQFGRRSSEAKPSSLQIGRKGNMGFVYQANTVVKQKTTQPPYMSGRMNRKPAPSYDGSIPSDSIPVETVKPATMPIKPSEVEKSVKTETSTVSVEKERAVPTSWLKQYNSPETDVKPKPFERSATSGMEYLNDLYNGIKHDNTLQTSGNVQLVEPPRSIEPPKSVRESVPDLSVNPVAAEDKEKRLKELISDQPEDISTVLQQAPVIIFGNAVRQFTTHPIDEEKLAEERSGYCIDNRWYKCGDWFAIDVIPHTARYVYNCKLGVSIEIPRSVHREYFTLNSQE